MPIDPADGDDDFVDQWADPDSELSEAEQPFGDPEQSVNIPEAPSVADYDSDGFDANQLSSDLSDVDSDLLNAFAVSVLLTNAGVLLVSLGILLITFRGQLEVGGGLVFAGAIALLRVGHHYRTYKQSRAADEDVDGAGDAGNDDAENAGDADNNTDAADTNGVDDNAEGTDDTEHNR